MNSKILFWLPGMLCLSLKANTGLSGEFSALNPCHTIKPAKNPALSALLIKPLLALSVSNLYTLKGLTDSELYAAFPYKHSGADITYNRFGNNVYTRNRLAIGISRRINPALCAGLRANYTETGISNYGFTHIFSLDAALFAGISKTISTAVTINSLKPFSSGKEIHKSLPGNFNWAVIINSGKSLKLCFEIEKTVHALTGINSNINYLHDSCFRVNLNFGNRFREIGFGIGYHKNRTTVGTGFRFHVLLGVSSNIHLIYEFKA